MADSKWIEEYARLWQATKAIHVKAFWEDKYNDLTRKEQIALWIEVEESLEHTSIPDEHGECLLCLAPH